MKKKYMSVLLAAAVALGGFSVYGGNGSTVQAAEEKDQLKVVTTIFPEYDWVKEIAGDKASEMDLTMLLDNGVDLHSYQPTADDIMKISDCDVFIYVGGESDGWVEDALKEAVNKDMKVVNLLEVLKDSVKTEEAKPGMQAEEGHNHGYSHFADSDVEDRSLTDWSGDWQSVYPYLEDGELDEVMERKAENGDKTAEEYKAYYETGYKTDVEKIVIDGEAAEYAISLKRRMVRRMHRNMCSSAIMELLREKQNISTFMQEMTGLMHCQRRWKTGRLIIPPI